MTNITLIYYTRKLVLPRPKFDDNDHYETNRINRKTRGGDIIVFRAPYWPINEKLTFSFDYQDQSLINNYLNFVRDTNGQLIQLIDYRGRIWNGIILNPENNVTQSGRFNFTLTLEFLINELLSDVPIEQDY